MERTSPGTESVIARGLLAAPLVAGVVGFVLFSWSIEMGLVMGVLFTIVATVITVLFAYPSLRWLMRRGQVTVVTALATGAVLGNVPTAVAAIGNYASTGKVFELAGLRWPIAAGTLAGLAAAGAFWAIAGPHLSARHAENVQRPQH